MTGSQVFISHDVCSCFQPLIVIYILAVEPLILEYFENNDASEVLYTLQEMLMNLGPRRWMVVSILVELAMDHKPSHREMASVLISELYLKVISQRDIGKGNL